MPGMQAFGWSSPETTPYLGHDVHSEQHWAMPVISRLASYPAPGMYASHAGSSSEELVSVNQGGSGECVVTSTNSSTTGLRVTNPNIFNTTIVLTTTNNSMTLHTSRLPLRRRSTPYLLGVQGPVSYSSLSGTGAGTMMEGTSVPGPSVMTGGHMAATDADLVDFFGIASRDSRLEYVNESKWDYEVGV